MPDTPADDAKHKRTAIRVGLLVALALLAALGYELTGLLLLRSRGVETTVEVTGDTHVHRVGGLNRRGRSIVIISTDEGMKSGHHWYYGLLDEDDETRLLRFEQPMTVGLRYPIVRDAPLVRTYDGGFYIGRKADSLWTIYANTEGTAGLRTWLALFAILPAVAAWFAHGVLTQLLPRWRAERAALKKPSIGSLLKDD